MFAVQSSTTPSGSHRPHDHVSVSLMCKHFAHGQSLQAPPIPSPSSAVPTAPAWSCSRPGALRWSRSASVTSTVSGNPTFAGSSGSRPNRNPVSHRGLNAVLTGNRSASSAWKGSSSGARGESANASRGQIREAFARRMLVMKPRLPCHDAPESVAYTDVQR